MKLIIIILILATVLIAGCTQQQPQANSNLTQVSENASKIINQTASNMNVQFSIELARNVQDVVNVGIRNTGQNDISMEGISAYVDGISKNTTGNMSVIKSGQVVMFNVTDAANSCNKTLKIVLSSGLSEQTIIMC